MSSHFLEIAFVDQTDHMQIFRAESWYWDSLKETESGTLLEEVRLWEASFSGRMLAMQKQSCKPGSPIPLMTIVRHVVSDTL
jgi:hypothetical protein